MKNILSTILLLLAFGAQAQNLVPNPDFSLRDSCPDSYSQITRCRYWYSSNRGTPDYFNRCGTGVMGVPANSIGNQDCRSGAYAGGFAIVGGTTILRENIVTDIPPLVIGATYKVTIRVSLSDNSAISCDGFGVYFYKFDLLGAMWGSMGYPTPQIDYTSYGILSDKTNWITMTKQFVADSAYKHICVGVLKPESALNTLVDSISSSNVAYYYYDSVAVEKISGGTGISELQTNLKVVQFPNPATHYCTLSIDGAITEPLTLTMFNSLGVVVRTIDNITNITTIYRNDLPTGMYTYKLSTTSGTAYIGRIVLE